MLGSALVVVICVICGVEAIGCVLGRDYLFPCYRVRYVSAFICALDLADGRGGVNPY